MKKKYWVWLGVLILLVVAIGVVVPGNPLYLVNWISPRAQYEGRSESAWERDLADPNPAVRQGACHALGIIGPDARGAIPLLVRVLRDDPDRRTRTEAALALTMMDKEAPEMAKAVPTLSDALKDDELPVRMYVVLSFRRLREKARPAIPQLAEALKDEANQTNLQAFQFTIEQQIVTALGGTGSGEAVPVLREVLTSTKDDRVRWTALHALGELGPEARPAAEQVRGFLNSEIKGLASEARETLRLIEGKTPEEPKNRSAADSADDLRLADKELEYLWEIEHHGNVLVKFGFGPLAQAIRDADRTQLTHLLADSFTGFDLREPRRVEAHTGYADVERLEDAGHPPLPLDRGAFAARLLEFRKRFAGTPGVKFALMSLHPRQRGRLDGPWEGTAQLRLHGEQAKGAPVEVILWLRYELPRPTEETLGRAGWLQSTAVQQVQSARAPHYLFREVAAERGLKTDWLHDNWKARELHTSPGGIYVCDYDRDGFLDVLVTDINGTALYRGRPEGKFEDVTEQVGLPRHPGPNTSAAWIDVDGDGWEDLIVSGRVYHNAQGQRFEDYGKRCNLRLPRDTSALLVADYDKDGKLDLYATRSANPGKHSWLDNHSGETQGNHLFRNKGNWQFEDVTEASGTSGDSRSTFTAAWLDANEDGWPDLHVINEFGDGVLLINNQNGTFTPHRLADHPVDFGSMGLAVGDVNNDGHIDLFCADMYSKAGNRVIGNLAPDAFPSWVMEKMKRFVAGSQLHLNRGGLQFEQVGPQMQVAGVGWSYGACLADLDNDGWLDLYATAGFVSRNRNEPDG